MSMIAVIVGRNRVEFCKIRPRDYDKTFFVHRGQQYMILPGNLVRMRYYDEDGMEIQEPDEAIIFEEGKDVAYDTAPELEDAYYQENVFPLIDLQRNVRTNKLRFKGILESANDMMRMLYPFAGLILLVGVLAYAFLA